MTAKGFARCLLLSLALVGACSDDDDSIGPTSGAGGEVAGGAGPEATAGAATEHAGNGSVGGNAPTLEGGAAQGGTGAAANEAGNPAMVAGGAGGAGGTTAEPGLERLGICARFTQKNVLASQFSLLFDKAIYADACVGWTTTLYEDEPMPARDDYTNALTAWSSALWGCTDSGVSGFALLFEQPDVLTAGDAKRLIDYYLLVLDVQLNTLQQAKLSPNEIQQLRAALERLSQTMITDPSLEYSHPECVNPPGGEGGAGGAAGGAGGEGSISPPIEGGGGQGGEPVFPSMGGGS